MLEIDTDYYFFMLIVLLETAHFASCLNLAKLYVITFLFDHFNMYTCPIEEIGNSRFPPSVGYASIAILTLGNGSAALFGKNLEKHDSIIRPKTSKLNLQIHPWLSRSKIVNLHSAPKSLTFQDASRRDKPLFEPENLSFSI